MRLNLRTVLALGIALCLGLTWACVRVDVAVTANDSTFSQHLSPIKDPISIDDLKKLQATTTCNPSSLVVSKELQETPAWCWAASSRMVMGFLNKKHNKRTDLQCEIARNVFNLSQNVPNCCDDNTSPQCIRGNWPHRVLDHYQFNYQWIAGPLDDWDALKGELCSSGPFITIIEWSGGGKHAFVVKGYDPEPEGSQLKKTVEIYDPFLNDPQDMTFEEFLGDSPKKEYEYHRFSQNLNIVQIQPKSKD